MASGSPSGQYAGAQPAQQGAPFPDAGGRNPHLPQPRTPRLTQEEINILEECNTESFWYRCVPLAVVFGGTTTILVRAGHLKPHPRYGATLKTMGAVLLAYIMGKLSYQNTCQQKILQKLPNSNLAQSVRKSRGMTTVSDSEMSTDAGPGFGYTQPAGKMREEYSSIDVSSDTQPSAVRELDDNLRPTMDREVKPLDEAAPASQRMLTYEELRQQNRQEYERSMATSPSSPFRQRPFPSPHPSRAPAPPAEPSAPSDSRKVWDAPPPPSPGRAFDSAGSRGQQKNQYGDVWDSN